MRNQNELIRRFNLSYTGTIGIVLRDLSAPKNMAMRSLTIYISGCSTLDYVICCFSIFTGHLNDTLISHVVTQSDCTENRIFIIKIRSKQLSKEKSV